jgi:hypothetical protein
VRAYFWIGMLAWGLLLNGPIAVWALFGGHFVIGLVLTAAFLAWLRQMWRIRREFR